MPSPGVAYFAGIGTVVAAIAIGFSGGLFLTSTTAHRQGPGTMAKNAGPEPRPAEAQQQSASGTQRTDAQLQPASQAPSSAATQQATNIPAMSWIASTQVELLPATTAFAPAEPSPAQANVRASDRQMSEETDGRATESADEGDSRRSRTRAAARKSDDEENAQARPAEGTQRSAERVQRSAERSQQRSHKPVATERDRGPVPDDEVQEVVIEQDQPDTPMRPVRRPLRQAGQIEIEPVPQPSAPPPGPFNLFGDLFGNGGR